MILEPFDFLSPAWRGGEEHLVWEDSPHNRYVKLTHANQFGLTVAAEWFIDEEKDEVELKPALRGATPLEYLERLLLHNAVFGDSIELLGIIDKRQALHVVITQPFIRGESSSTARIVAFMRALGFTLLPEIAVGRRGAVSFFRESDGIAAFDCHPANFLSAGHDLFPIDTLLVRAGDDLRSALAATNPP